MVELNVVRSRKSYKEEVATPNVGVATSRGYMRFITDSLGHIYPQPGQPRTIEAHELDDMQQKINKVDLLIEAVKADKRL